MRINTWHGSSVKLIRNVLQAAKALAWWENLFWAVYWWWQIFRCKMGMRHDHCQIACSPEHDQCMREKRSLRTRVTFVSSWRSSFHDPNSRARRRWCCFLTDEKTLQRAPLSKLYLITAMSMMVNGERLGLLMAGERLGLFMADKQAFGWCSSL